MEEFFRAIKDFENEQSIMEKANPKNKIKDEEALRFKE